MQKINRFASRLSAVINARRERRRQEQVFADAAAELRRYSDAQLQDIGLHRTNIDHAVRHGRSGIAH